MSDAQANLVINATKGVGLVFLSQTGQYFVVFLVNIVLARILSPGDFGVFALASVATGFVQLFTNLSNERYLVQVKGNFEEKYCTLFTVEFVLSLVFFILTVCSAGAILPRLGMGEAVLPVQVLALTFFYTPFKATISLLDKEMRFLRSKTPALIGQIAGGGIAAVCAVAGAGFWSLVVWRLAAMSSELVAAWFFSPERPRLILRMSMGTLNEILKFSLPLLGANLLIYYYTNIDYCVVGKLLGKELLGYYWLAFSVSHALLKARTAVNSVILPVFCKTEDDAVVVRYFEKITRITALIYLLPAVLFFVFGRELVVLIYGDKWLPAVPIFKVFMVLIALRAVTGYADNVFLYKGRSDIAMKLTLIYALLLSPAVYCGTKYFGLIGAAASVLFVNGIVSAVLIRYVFLLTGHKMGYLVKLFIYPVAVLAALEAVSAVLGINLLFSCVSLAVCGFMVWRLFLPELLFLRGYLAALRRGAGGLYEDKIGSVC